MAAYLSFMLQVSHIYIYPIKSLGGISISSAVITDRGFQFDRRWMLVDDTNRFLSQREIPAMALLRVEMVANGLEVHHKEKQHSITIPFLPVVDTRIEVDIWGVSCKAQLVDPAADEWFSTMLDTPCRLVYMAEETIVKVDQQYSVNNALTSFSDGYPILMISEASLEDLNNKIDQPLPINRFRPNLVFTGGEPFIEDTMKEFTINGFTFYGVKPSARCILTTIDQHTAKKGKEPLQTLATYRKKDARIYFGQNVIAAGKGKINVGDEISIVQKKLSLF